MHYKLELLLSIVVPLSSVSFEIKVIGKVP